MANSVARRSVSVILLGRMGFMPALDVQNRYAKLHLDELAGKPYAFGQNTLLIVEHTPVYTVGIRTQDYTDNDVNQLKATGAEFYKTNRGGLITFHGPGQMVAYPILNLKRFKPSMKWYVQQLEQTLINTLGHFDLEGRTTDQTGVWVKDRKIASIGVHGTRYITTHGVSLNCNTDLDWYKHIIPCGLKGVDMTSVSRELGKIVPFTDSIKPFLRSFSEVFNCELELFLLDEKELKAISLPSNYNNTHVPSAATGSSNINSESDSIGMGSLKLASEVGLRHMSTSAVFPTLPTRSFTPMW